MRFPYDPVVPKKWEDLQIGSLCVKNSWFYGKYSHRDKQQTACLEVSGSTMHEIAKLQ